MKEDEIMDLSWRLEGAVTLGWVLGLIPELHSIETEVTPEIMEEFESKIPELGGSTLSFLENLNYTDIENIYDENLLNEFATAYFRDLFFNGKQDETSINRMVSFERHYTLNWVRQCFEISEWDLTDTST